MTRMCPAARRMIATPPGPPVGALMTVGASGRSRRRPRSFGSIRNWTANCPNENGPNENGERREKSLPSPVFRFGLLRVDDAAGDSGFHQCAQGHQAFVDE